MMGGHGRTLQEKSTNSAVRLIGADGAKAVAIKSGAAASASVLGTAAAMVDPYDIENFEKAVGNALAKVKPPMTPGDSGEAFYRTIPFQVRPRWGAAYWAKGMDGDVRCGHGWGRGVCPCVAAGGGDGGGCGVV